MFRPWGIHQRKVDEAARAKRSSSLYYCRFPCTNSPIISTSVTYRLGSVNFSRRKIGHAHDNSVDSENAAGAREPNVHAHFIFRFENGQGNQSFFSIHDQNTTETSQPQAHPTDN